MFHKYSSKCLFIIKGKDKPNKNTNCLPLSCNHIYVCVLMLLDKLTDIENFIRISISLLLIICHKFTTFVDIHYAMSNYNKIFLRNKK